MHYDVVVLGSAISGSTMAAVLARQGLSVLVLDKGHHPRFALGESMIPGTSWLLRIMAKRYGVPELDHISTFLKQRRHVTSSSGMKRNFSFVHHRAGEPFDPRHSTMLPVPHHPHGPESHLFRQDVDAYLFHAAVRYGAEMRQGEGAESVDEMADGMRVTTSSGRTVEAKYVIDCTNAASILARRFQLRETPTRLRTRSNCIFTHMVGVKPFDHLYGAEAHGLPQPLSQGTLHHIFDGGWLWIIPFDNHEAATNPLCSIGLHLDLARRVDGGPDDARTPEERFGAFLREYPEIARQFEDARPVRSWVTMPRAQYSSKAVLGSRYCVLAQAAGAVDAIFSRGMYITMEVINALAHRVVSAVREDDFAAPRFAPIERLTQGLLDAHDRLAHGSYVAFRDFAVWNAWYRVWALGGTLTSLRFRRAHIKYELTSDMGYLDALENHEYVGTPSPDLPEYQELFEAAYAVMLRLESGELTCGAAVDALYALYADKSWIPPVYDLTNPDRRYITRSDFDALVNSTVWGYSQAPRSIKDRYFDFPPSAIFGPVEQAAKAEEAWRERTKGATAYGTFDLETLSRA